MGGGPKTGRYTTDNIGFPVPICANHKALARERVQFLKFNDIYQDNDEVTGLKFISYLRRMSTGNSLVILWLLEFAMSYQLVTSRDKITF